MWYNALAMQNYALITTITKTTAYHSPKWEQFALSLTAIIAVFIIAWGICELFDLND